MDGVIEGFALHILHNDEEHAVDIAEVINPDKIRVIEAGHGLGLGLGLEGFTKVLIGSELTGKNFDRNGPVEGFLECLVDRSHSAFGDKSFNLVGRK